MGLAVAPGVGGAVVASGAGALLVAAPDDVAAVEDALHPRWVWWSSETAAALVRAGVHIAMCWDIEAVHRVLFGGWAASPAVVWARLAELSTSSMPAPGPPDLFTQADRDEGDREDPRRPDGHLRPEWAEGGWARSPSRLATWARLALEVARLQQERLAALTDHPRAPASARAESAAALLCVELSRAGLPVDRSVAEQTIGAVIGPRPGTEAEAAAQRDRRDAEVLRHAPAGTSADLRSPGQVKSLLRSVGIEVPDTRAWRLRELRDVHPIVPALLAWRKAERVATTYGYSWLDEHLGADGRLRGAWSASDGAAGRMTASAGLHNMPADLRVAVVAEPGQVFVRADLGQIEPRVLAAVSGDRRLARASHDADMYAPVASALHVDRDTAKVAVLGAMYGQTTGHGAAAGRGLRAAYPVAMAYLDDADRAAQGGRELRTYGGRALLMGSTGTSGMSDQQARARAAARGRYGRNAMVQGAAAELFKVWAVTVRARARELGGQIVLCLHDELLVQAPAAQGSAVASLLDTCLQEAAARWCPGTPVRFVADIRVISRWADAKG